MRDRKSPVVIYTAPNLSAAEEARQQIRTAADSFHQMAAKAHSEGMFFEGQSARLEMLAEGVEDDEIVRIRDCFVQEGVIELETLTAATNASGGDA